MQLAKSVGVDNNKGNPVNVSLMNFLLCMFLDIGWIVSLEAVDSKLAYNVNLIETSADFFQK
jgi:hypothetical protein